MSVFRRNAPLVTKQQRKEMKKRRNCYIKDCELGYCTTSLTVYAAFPYNRNKDVTVGLSPVILQPSREGFSGSFCPGVEQLGVEAGK